MVLYRRNFFQGVSLSPKNRPFGVQKVGKKAFLEFMAKNQKNSFATYRVEIQNRDIRNPKIPKTTNEPHYD